MQKKSFKFVFIGFQTAGKSTIAKALANQLAISFVDTDQLIEEQHFPLSCREIFQQFGENYFREIEKKMCFKAIELQYPLIAVGGGAPLDCFNSDYQLIYLKGSLSTLRQRENQKILSGAYLQQQSLESLFSNRSLYYEKFANHVIENDHLTVNQVIQNIREIYGI